MGKQKPKLSIPQKPPHASFCLLGKPLHSFSVPGSQLLGTTDIYIIIEMYVLIVVIMIFHIVGVFEMRAGHVEFFISSKSDADRAV